MILAASKLIRFGLETYPGYGENTEQFGLELGDFLEVLTHVMNAGLVRSKDIQAGQNRKRERLKIFTRHVR